MESATRVASAQGMVCRCVTWLTDRIEPDAHDWLMTFRPQLVSLLAIVPLALVALGGAEHSASASPAPQSSSAVSGGITGDVSGGEVTITPITQADFEKSQGPSNCVTQGTIILCQQASLEKSARWERVDYSATAYVGQTPGLHAVAQVDLAEGYRLTSTGTNTANTSPYVRIDWKNTPNPLAPYNGPDIDIPAEASGENFSMTLGSLRAPLIQSNCSSEPGPYVSWDLDCDASDLPA